MKKHIYLLIAFMLFLITAHSQVPQKFNYQAVLRDNSGQPLVNTALYLRISLISYFPIDTVYSEQHYAYTNQLGLVTVEVGGGSVLKGQFSSIDWNKTEMHMLVETDVNATGTYTYMGDTRLLSVPYAMVAGKVLETPEHINLNMAGYLFTTTLRDSTVLNNDSVVIPKTGKYLLTMDATGYGIVYNYVTGSGGDNDVAMRIFNNSNQMYYMPLHDYKKDDGYPTGAYNLTPRQTALVRTVNLTQGDVIRIGIRIGSFGTPQNNTPLGYLNYDMNLIKID